MKRAIITIAVIVLVIILLLLVGKESAGKNGKNLDAFAQCLAEKKITMYGAESCTYCQKEKSNFGDAFRFVPYIECPQEPQRCLDQGITNYPTWIFPNDRRLTGLQSLEKLAQESGCRLP